MEKQSRDLCRVQKKKKEGVTMKRKRGLVHVILALLMSMLLVVSTGCGKSGSGDSSSDKKTDKTWNNMQYCKDIVRQRHLQM